MKYPLRNKGNKKKIRRALVALFLFLFLTIAFFGPSIIPGKINNLGKPFWSFGDSFLNNFGSVFAVLHSKSFLVAENERLEKELKSAELINLKVNLLEKENNELKNVFNENDSNELLRVLSRSSQSPHDTFIIDTKNKKVLKGQEVLSKESILIGLIDEVYDKSARVVLLSEAGRKYQVEIGDDSIEGVAVGLGGGNFEITLPRGIDVEIGDEVISPDLEIRILGIVEHIDSKPQNSFQKILFKSPVNINQIKWVRVYDR